MAYPHLATNEGGMIEAYAKEGESILKIVRSAVKPFIRW